MLDPTPDTGKELVGINYDELSREVAELRQELERERILRQHTEERNRQLEAQAISTSLAPSPRSSSTFSAASSTSTHLGHISPPLHSYLHHHDQSSSHLNSPINLKMVGRDS